MTNTEMTMLKKILLAATGTLAALGSTAVLADPPHWAPAHGWRAHNDYAHAYREHYRPRYYAYAPRPVYVMPAPRVFYTPAPVVYAPAPVYRPAPAYAEPSFSIRLDFPL